EKATPVSPPEHRGRLFFHRLRLGSFVPRNRFFGRLARLTAVVDFLGRNRFFLCPFLFSFTLFSFPFITFTIKFVPLSFTFITFTLITLTLTFTPLALTVGFILVALTVTPLTRQLVYPLREMFDVPSEPVKLFVKFSEMLRIPGTTLVPVTILASMHLFNSVVNLPGDVMHTRRGEQFGSVPDHFFSFGRTPITVVTIATPLLVLVTAVVFPFIVVSVAVLTRQLVMIALPVLRRLTDKLTFLSHQWPANHNQ
ncbi:MAG: hypothetical protein VX877_01300, partial [Planctomycetota bacterium]|nr:hypothetical protein [Planctomycetota bacterium]